MALSYANTDKGIALIRKPAGSDPSNWTHVTWVNGERDMYVDNPSAGDFDYQYIIVLGAAAVRDGTDIDSIVVSGRQQVAYANMKR